MSLTRDRVTLFDVQQALSSTTAIKSGMGGQVAILEAGGGGSTSPIAAQSRAEAEMLRRAPVFRCVAELSRHATCRFAPCADLKRFAAAAKLPEGAVAVGVLRAYMPWDAQWKMRGLVQVYNWMRQHCTDLPAIHVGDETSEAQAFRQGTDKKAKNKAVALLADAEVVLSMWVERWNVGRRPEEGIRQRDSENFNPEVLSHLAERRWVPLEALITDDGPSLRTMQRWCEDKRLPANKRGGRKWWVDVEKLKIDFDPECEEENVWYAQLARESFAKDGY